MPEHIHCVDRLRHRVTPVGPPLITPFLTLVTGPSRITPRSRRAPLACGPRQRSQPHGGSDPSPATTSENGSWPGFPRATSVILVPEPAPVTTVADVSC